MECELCYEQFNRCERLPKVLQKCGHTFCEVCVSQCIQSNQLNCPYCRLKIDIGTGEYPPNNFALLHALDSIQKEREGNGISKYYKPSYIVSQSTIGANVNRREIYEYLKRENSPIYLRLNSILDNGEAQFQETTYEEIQKISAQNKPALVKQNSQLAYSRTMTKQASLEVEEKNTAWRYSSHPNSLFTWYFGMNLRKSSYLAPFKKHFTCAHMFGCLENLIRKFLKATAFWLCAKGTISFLMGINIDEQAVTFAKDNWQALRGHHDDLIYLGWFTG